MHLGVAVISTERDTGRTGRPFLPPSWDYRLTPRRSGHDSRPVMLFPHLSGVAGAKPLLVLAAALLLDGFFGEFPLLFRLLPHPVALVGRAIAALDRRLNRDTRPERDRFVRGIVTVLLLGLAAIGAGLVVAWFCHVVGYGWALETLIVAVLLAQRSLFDHVASVERALSVRGLAAGRDAVRHIVGRDPANLDEHGVARAAIESLAENFSDGVVAPALWYALLGLPGLFLYKTVNTLDSMIGHRSPKYRAFGWAAARLDDVMNFVPARLAGLALALAGLLLPGMKSTHAVTAMIRDAGKHRSVNAGWPEAAMAGALGLALAGPRRYGGAVVEDAWIGSGRARAMPADIGRALALYVVACLVHGGVIFSLYLALAIGRGATGSLVFS
jgi:adenosylcobinamide-phosphate synthase